MNVTIPGTWSGTAGIDFSINAPSLPVVGAGFAAGGPYSGYALLATVPASFSRANIEVQNASGGPIVLLRDDGTAPYGGAPANASLIPLSGSTTVGQQGGSWSSTTFKGRLQVYGPSAAAQISIYVD